MARGRSPHHPAFSRLGSDARLLGVGQGRISVSCSRFSLEAQGRVVWPQVPAHELFGRDGRIAGSADELVLVRLTAGSLTELDGVSDIAPGLYLISNTQLVRVGDETPETAGLEGEDLVSGLARGLSHADVRHLQETLWATDEDGGPSALTIACKVSDYRDVDVEATERLLAGLAGRGLVFAASEWDGYRLTELGFFLLSRA